MHLLSQMGRRRFLRPQAVLPPPLMCSKEARRKSSARAQAPRVLAPLHFSLLPAQLFRFDMRASGSDCMVECGQLLHHRSVVAGAECA